MYTETFPLVLIVVLCQGVRRKVPQFLLPCVLWASVELGNFKAEPVFGLPFV